MFWCTRECPSAGLHGHGIAVCEAVCACPAYETLPKGLPSWVYQFAFPPAVVRVPMIRVMSCARCSQLSNAAVPGVGGINICHRVGSIMRLGIFRHTDQEFECLFLSAF